MIVDRCEHVDVPVNGTQMADNGLQVMGNELQVDVSNERDLLHLLPWSLKHLEQQAPLLP